MLECTARLEEDIFCRSPHHPLLIFGAQEGQAIENEIERLRISVGRLHLKWRIGPPHQPLGSVGPVQSMNHGDQIIEWGPLLAQRVECRYLDIRLRVPGDVTKSLHILLAYDAV